MGAEPPDEYVRAWTERTAARPEPVRSRPESVVLFRVGAEWFALPTEVCEQVVPGCLVHTLPGRGGPVLRGIGSVGGELFLVISLAGLLAAPQPAAPSGRTMILRWLGSRYACPVDEVHGVHRFHPEDRLRTPDTAASTFTEGLFPWNGAIVARLAVEPLFGALERELS